MSDIFKVKVNGQWVGLETMKGDQGPTGPSGPQGVVGPRGPQGLTGPQGPQGIQGVIGPTGPQGIQGIQGPKGDRGEKGDTGNTGPQGIQGPQGLQGDKGDKGDAATITIGTVTQGNSMSVTNSGTVNDAVLDFVLVKGDKGDKGDTGDTGPQGIQGEAGPQGIQGETGPQGPQGNSASFSGTNVNVNQLTPGSTPTVSATITGPATASVLNMTFGLPTTPNFSEVTIPTSAWSYRGNSIYSANVTLSGITASSTLLVGGQTDSMDDIVHCGIYCSGQSTNTLTFTTISIPSGPVSYGVYWL